ncbi:hypothetical protein KAFR_0C00950 [Kazachstania africana CBS 2517]|uniref:Pyridoxamine kinase/Phosphomethylpyrimidine kinase domain-containing protein n=1 Tax=Kazachstania africana (strain ATCC 22294 / BCRC 22015 / CBS 2517 / CECT 1963 / NBRC 1671 / NRRL Y-8276) TaxID=1071382 RepID=H2ARU0_KAZAF|nr:hypothetical protein KAFR_0C00950 [Kazachstania africana CBS 2517]CCF57090.1 hypothetical protein KAFR_0C00950 [Kazachstania africana CBS 2517]
MPYETIQINTPPPYLTLNRSEKLPTVLIIAGSDCSGGAGIEADLKTITAHRCYAETCITAVTVQTPVSVFDVHNIPKSIISGILDNNLRDMKCDVIKTGMLTYDAIISLNEKLEKLDELPKLVIDPVLVATSGSTLTKDELVGLMKEKITPWATLLTPNIPECFKLIGEERNIRNLDDVFQLAKQVMSACSCSNLLVKGGHIPWDSSDKKYITDVLLLGKEKKFIVFKGHYVDTANTHGTGCSLASSIASNLARGYSLPQAVYGGIEYVQNAVAIGCDVTKDHVRINGPINHIYAVEIPLEKMIADECFEADHILDKYSMKLANNIGIGKPLEKPSFVKYLQEHPRVKPHWQSYIKHDFVKKIADGTLEPSKFQFFVEQDYSYLIDYARVHCIAASKMPSFEDMEKELTIVGGVKNEMQHHRERLQNHFNVTESEYFDNISRSTALKNYSRYFNDVAKRGNWQELVTALTPCLMGYGHALYTFEDSISTKNPLYLDWLSVYSSEWYRKAMEDGEILMNHVLQTYPSENVEALVQIYADVCELETKFWDSALNFSPENN